MPNFTRMSTLSILLSYMVLLSSMLSVAADSGRYAERVSTVDRVDVIEFNYFYDDQGRFLYTQFIFWDYDESLKRYVVREWTLTETSIKGSLVFTVWENPITRETHLVYKDLEYGFRRHIIGESYRVSHGQVDPERKNKKVLPEDLREKLSVPPWLVPKTNKIYVEAPSPIIN